MIDLIHGPDILVFVPAWVWLGGGLLCVWWLCILMSRTKPRHP